MKTFIILSALVCLALLASARIVPRDDFEVTRGEFEQKLDQFNSDDKRKWTQVYYSYDGYYEEGGPTFVFIATPSLFLDPLTLEDVLFKSRIGQIAEELNGRIISLQPRFFDESRPTGDLSLASLQYLNVQETLADFANFLTFIRGEDGNNKIILFGEDSGATYAIWTKKIYPAVADGVIAYGPRLEARIELPEYYTTVMDTIATQTPECAPIFANALKEFTELVETGDAEAITSAFNLESPINVKDALEVAWFYVYIIKHFSVHYVYSDVEYQNFYCDYIIEHRPEDGTDLDAVSNAFKTLDIPDTFNMNYRSKVDLLKDISWDSYAARSYDRQNMYRACNEYSWFSTSILLDPPASDKFPISVFVGMCQDIFGPQFTEAHIRSRNDYINLVFGGAGPQVDNVYITYGEFDPYRIVGPAEDLNPSSPVDIVEGAEKRFDFMQLDESESEERSATKIRAKELILEWISE